MSTIEQVLAKLTKLKEQAAAAPDLLALDKIAAKADKIKQKLSQHRSNKQLNGILDKIQLLIQEKSKYFRHIIIKKSDKLIAEDNTRFEQADRTLKYSKSADSLKLITSKKEENSRRVDATPSASEINYSTTTNVNTQNRGHDTQEMNRVGSSSQLQPGRNQQNQSATFKGSHTLSMTNSKKGRGRVELDQDAQKTTIHYQDHEDKKKLESEIGFLEQKLTFSFKQIEDLNKKITTLQESKQKNRQSQTHTHLSPSNHTYFKKQQSIVDEYSSKLKEKTFIIEELKAKIEYFKSMNEELKNKVINDQRRNEDYIEGLRSEIKNLKRELEVIKKDNEQSRIQIEDLEEKNNGLMGEVKKLVAKLQEESKQKEGIKRNSSQAASAKIQEQQKQIQQLMSQVQSLSKLEVTLQHEEEERKRMQEFRSKLELRIAELQGGQSSLRQERDRLEISLCKVQEQMEWLKGELRVSIEAKQMLADELLDAKQKLDKYIRTQDLRQYQNELKTKSKLGKLKELKGLLLQIK